MAGVLIRSSSAIPAVASDAVVSFRSSTATFPRGGTASSVGPGKFWIGLSYTADDGRSWTKREPPHLDQPTFITQPSEWQHTRFVSEMQGWLTGFGHVWATHDGGATWHIRFDGRPFAWAFTAGNAGWSASGDRDEIRNYVTSDMGGTWHECGRPWHMSDYAPFVSAFFITPNIGWTVIAKYNDRELPEEQGLAKTEDGGCTWTPIWWRPQETETLSDVNFVDRSTGWMSSLNQGPLLETTDGGVNWQRVPLPSKPFTIYSAYAIGKGAGFVYGDQPSRLSSSQSGVYITRDRGETWLELSNEEVMGKKGIAKSIPSLWTGAAVRRLYLMKIQREKQKHH